MNIAAQAARNLGGFVPNKIFIGGVPITCTEEQFRNYFEPYGPIAKVELHALRGFGYITYESVESVDACLEKYEEHYLCKKWVEVKRSIPRELIDAYEREQRRLHAEAAAADGGEKLSASVDNNAKGEPSLPAPANPAPAAWGGGGGPAQSMQQQRRGGPPGPSGRDAPGAGAGMLSRVAHLREMGFSDAVARKVLAECAWDVNAAIDKLLTGGIAMEEEEPPPPPPPPAPVPAPAPAVPEVATPVAASVKIEEAHAESPEKAPHETSAEEASPAQANGGFAMAASDRAASDAPAGAVARTPSPAPAAPPLPSVSSPKKQQTSSTVAEAAAEATSIPATNDVQDADANTSPAEFVVDPSQPPPRKRIERANSAWSAEDMSQLAVAEKEFVHVWCETETNNGWIYAEACEDLGRVGWLPVRVLQPLPEGRRWMQAIQAWQGSEEAMLSVSANGIVNVWVQTRTDAGWAYAESDSDGELKGGWLPVFTLAWPEDL